MSDYYVSREVRVGSYLDGTAKDFELKILDIADEDDPCPIQATLGCNSTWLSVADLTTIKNAINRAIRERKELLKNATD